MTIYICSIPYIVTKGYRNISENEREKATKQSVELAVKRIKRELEWHDLSFVKVGDGAKWTKARSEFWLGLVKYGDFFAMRNGKINNEVGNALNKAWVEMERHLASFPF